MCVNFFIALFLNLIVCDFCKEMGVEVKCLKRNEGRKLERGWWQGACRDWCRGIGRGSRGCEALGVGGW